MARDFDGANDVLNLGQDASIANWTQFTVWGWFIFDAIGYRLIWTKNSAGTDGIYAWIKANTGVRKNSLHVTDHGWDTTPGAWYSTTQLTGTGTRIHIAFQYNGGGGTGEDATIWLDGVDDSAIEQTTPVGSYADDDSGNDLLVGEDWGGSGDVNARITALGGTEASFTTAQVNRAMWWGRPHGGIDIYHPMWTTKTANEGGATADATYTGTTVASFPVPTVRPGSAMMGMGVGW
jgi:hypothetical protein